MLSIRGLSLFLTCCIAAFGSPSRRLGGRVQTLRLNAVLSSVANATDMHTSHHVDKFRDAETAGRANVSSRADMGDLACMHWTGGHCRMAGCKEERGPTECVDGLCMCPQGYCANAWGKCVNTPGEFIGSYAVRFTKPYKPDKAYVGVTTEESTSVFSDSDKVTFLSAYSKKEPAWRLALTAAGFVRLESLEAPGNILTIHYNRRRRTNNLLQQHEALTVSDTTFLEEKNTTFSEDKNATHSSKGHSKRHAISDDDDLWPILKPFDQATPIDSTFQVRAVEGGHELWDPQFKVSLASADPDWMIDDAAADRGIAECSPNGWFGSSCEGRHSIAFEPSLPAKAISPEQHIVIQAVTDLYWWQTVLLILFVILFIVSIVLCVLFMRTRIMG